MRPIERIDNFLEKVNWNKLFEKWGMKFDSKKYYYLEDFEKLFVEYWKANPDQRIGQVLINLGIIYDSLDIWCSEEHQILIDQGIPPEECLYWTSMYDKDGNLLEKPIARKVSELSKEHIRNIFKFMEAHNGRISTEMEKAFKNVLNKKEETFDENSEVP